jgi:hypothetical protein
MEDAIAVAATPCAFAAAGRACPTCQQTASFHPGHGFRRATATVLARHQLPEDVLERVRGQPICEPCGAWGRYEPTGNPRDRPPKQPRQPLAPLPLPNGQALPPARVVAGERHVPGRLPPPVVPAQPRAGVARRECRDHARRAGRARSRLQVQAQEQAVCKSKRKSKPFSSLASPTTRLKRIRAYAADMREAHERLCMKHALDNWMQPRIVVPARQDRHRQKGRQVRRESSNKARPQNHPRCTPSAGPRPLSRRSCPCLALVGISRAHLLSADIVSENHHPVTYAPPRTVEPSRGRRCT